MNKVVARLRAWAPYVAIVLGLVVLCWPVAQAWLEAWEASQGIDAVTSTYSEMNDPERSAVCEAAVRYNELLATDGDLALTRPYAQQLSYEGSAMIAYISVPKAAIRLPIYHGTDDTVLMSGVGHLEGTSLPVGGASTHCVLTAHTGMPGRRMFDDIGVLEPGDEFCIWVLGEPMAYRVTGSEVVEPTQVESLTVQSGRDFVTLVTCTPYGVNSHRLLVHAERCAYTPDAQEQLAAAVYVNTRTLPLLIALSLLVFCAIVWLRRRGRA